MTTRTLPRDPARARSIPTERAAATRRDGALVGGAIGLLAAAAATIPVPSGGSFEAWILASIPAGVAAGAIVAPGIRPEERLSFRRIAAAAFIALLVGDAIVCLGISIISARGNDWSALEVILNAIAMWGWAIPLVGWLAMLILIPIAGVGAVVLRERTRRAGRAA
jgi:hypothetical protein